MFPFQVVELIVQAFITIMSPVKAYQPIPSYGYVHVNSIASVHTEIFIKKYA